MTANSSNPEINHWLSNATKKLEATGVSTSRLDCLILLEDELSKDRSWILAHLDTELSKSQIKKLNSKITKRAKHIPLAYIRQKTEFYGRKFFINKRVLEPRPETEAMIDLLKKYVNEPNAWIDVCEHPFIADVGTGSGAIGITAKLEIPEAKVDLIDIDPDALAVANHNGRKHKVKLQYYQDDLIDKTKKRFYDILLCNLPYVPDSHTINEAAMWEPKIAIFGGKDGLGLYRKLFDQIQEIIDIDKSVYRTAEPPKYIFTESLPPQHKELTKIAKASGYKQIDQQDFIQVFQYHQPKTT